jgi:nucleoside triphosphatase
MGNQLYPEPTVGGIVFNPEGEILLLKSRKSKDRYVIPGGHIELGETMESALKREILEETGLVIHDAELVSIQQFIFSDSFHEKRHFIFIDYACRADTKEVRLNDEHQDFVWLPLDKAFDLPLENFTERLLAEYRKGGDSGHLRRVLYNYVKDESG